jgi:hypothetical protein
LSPPSAPWAGRGFRDDTGLPHDLGDGVDAAAVAAVAEHMESRLVVDAVFATIMVVLPG